MGRLGQLAGHPAGSDSAVDWQVLVERCQRRLAQMELAVPESFRPEQFAAELAARRRRPITLTEVHLPPGTGCGLVVSLPRMDHVFYASTLSTCHTLHKGAHELAHLLWGHRSVVPDAEVANVPGSPDAVDAARLRRWLDTDSNPRYHQLAEAEADAMATVLLADNSPPPARWATRSAVRAGAQRLTEAFG